MKALLTGANSLLNKVLLQKLIDLGYEVVAHYHSDNEIATEMKNTFSQVKFLQADFSTEQGFTEFQKQVTELGKYDVMVNGAVYYAEANSWEPQLNWNEWQKSFAINTISAGMIMSHADQLVND